MRLCTEDAIYYLTRHTRTIDEQEEEKAKRENRPPQPIKPFPDYPYFRDIYAAWKAESILYVEKSRTLMLSWLFSGLCLHYAMTHPATRVIMWSKDEARSLHILWYACTLWDLQDDFLKKEWPLSKPLERKPHDKLGFANRSEIVAIPGGDPDRIRKDHPTIVFFDEAAIIDKFAESYGVALAARPTKIVAISSAKPGEFRTITKDAKPVEWPYAS